MKTVKVSEETKDELRILIADIVNSKPSISISDLISKYGETKEEDNE